MGDKLISMLTKLIGAPATAAEYIGDDQMHEMAMQQGRRNKKAIDGHHTNRDYRQTDYVHRETLQREENKYWYERDSRFDLDKLSK